MNAQTVSRDRILSGIRRMNAGRESHYNDIQRSYESFGSLSPRRCRALMIDRLLEYDAEVTECTPGQLVTTIREELVASARRLIIAPAELNPDWLVDGVDWLVDHALPQAHVEAAEGVITGCFCGIAESATIVLHHGPSEGRRLLTLLPDWHMCVLRASQIVEKLPEYFARCTEPPTLATYISGPSATADIEMTRIKGVHGPRFLHVIIVRDDE